MSYLVRSNLLMLRRIWSVLVLEGDRTNAGTMGDSIGC